MQLMADHEVRDDAVVVRFEGEVDMAVADEFASHLKTGLDEASGDQPLIIDLDAVSFFGSSALNDVASCHDEGPAKGLPYGWLPQVPLWFVSSKRQDSTRSSLSTQLSTTRWRVSQQARSTRARVQAE
jgi:hypothetical protein